MSSFFRITEGKRLLKVKVITSSPGSYILSCQGIFKIFVGTKEDFIRFLRNLSVSDAGTLPLSHRFKTYKDIVDDITEGRESYFMCWLGTWNEIQDRIHIQEAKASKIIKKGYSYFVSLKNIAQRLIAKKSERDLTASEKTVLNEITNFVKEFKKLIQQREDDIFDITNTEGKKDKNKLKKETERIKSNYATMFNSLFEKTYKKVIPIYKKSKTEKGEPSIDNITKEVSTVKKDVGKEDKSKSSTSTDKKKTVRDDVREALLKLGYKKEEINRVFKNMSFDTDVQTEIKKALKTLKK